MENINQQNQTDLSTILPKNQHDIGRFIREMFSELIKGPFEFIDIFGNIRITAFYPHTDLLNVAYIPYIVEAKDKEVIRTPITFIEDRELFFGFNNPIVACKIASAICKKFNDSNIEVGLLPIDLVEPFINSRSSLARVNMNNRNRLGFIRDYGGVLISAEEVNKQLLVDNFKLISSVDLEPHTHASSDSNKIINFNGTNITIEKLQESTSKYDVYACRSEHDKGTEIFRRHSVAYTFDYPFIFGGGNELFPENIILKNEITECVLSEENKDQYSKEQVMLFFPKKGKYFFPILWKLRIKKLFVHQ